MCQERLRGLALISVEHDVRRSLDMEDIIAAFAQAKARKQKFKKQIPPGRGCGYETKDH